MSDCSNAVNIISTFFKFKKMFVPSVGAVFKKFRFQAWQKRTQHASTQDKELISPHFYITT